jgi:transmembrane sensor
MDLKESNKTANSTQQSDVEKKLKFFWERCQSQNIDPDITDAIIEKTRRKIYRHKIVLKKRRYIATAISIAACALIVVGITIFVHYGSDDLSMDLRSMADNMLNQSSKNVTLISSGSCMNLKNNTFIKYTEDGKVIVDSSKVQNNQKTEQEEFNQLWVPAGKRASIELSDGTKLIVNSLSKVIYPRHFVGETRRIYAEGEVYFNVAHDAEHPFIVTSKDFDLQVLGTQFNICTYRGLETNVVLVHGSVAITDKNKKKETLKPNEMLSFSDGNIIQKTKVDVTQYISWVDGLLLIDGERLGNIVHRLSIYYGVRISCSPKIYNSKIYGKLDMKDNINDVLKCIQQVVPFDIENRESNIYLTN